MRLRTLARVACVGAALAAWPVEARETANCNTSSAPGLFFSVPNSFPTHAFTTIGDVNMQDRLFWPTRVRVNTYPWGTDVLLEYPYTTDVPEVARELNADRVLREMGVPAVWINGYGCFGTNPYIPPTPIVEFTHAPTGRYFLAAGNAQIEAYGNGSEGIGWQRTGEVFQVVAWANPCYGSHSHAFRFTYQPAHGPRSHYDTYQPEVCGLLRHDGAMRFEGVPYAVRPVEADGTCKPPRIAVYRAYNGKYATNESNHRYMVRRELYDAMVAQGWLGEGIAYCILPNPDRTWE